MEDVLGSALIREELKVLLAELHDYGFETEENEFVELDYSNLVEIRRQLRDLLHTMSGSRGR